MRSSLPAILALSTGLSLLSAAEEPASVGHVPELKAESESKASFKNLAPLIGALKEDSKLTLYEGLPRGRDLIDSEKKAKKTITRYSYSFCEVPNAVSEEDAKRLKVLLQDPKAFEEFHGFKLCGGFHPDFALVWKDGDAELEFHLCFGCHEFRTWRNDAEVYGEISGAAFAGLKEILENYRKQAQQR